MPDTVTVVTAVRNGWPWVVESVESILNQTIRDLTLVVVDDASTDETADYLRSIDDERVVVHRFPFNVGRSAARNHAVHTAESTYVAISDADDISEPTRLEMQLAWLEADARRVMVGCGVTDFGEWGERRSVEFSGEQKLARERAARRWSPIAHPSMLVRRDAFLAAGGYTLDQHRAQDLDLILRLLEVGEWGVIPEPLVRYRRPLASPSKRYWLQNAFYAQLARTRDEARRAGRPEPDLVELATDPRTALKLHMLWYSLRFRPVRRS